MTKVLAAIDNSLVSRAVLDFARALGSVLGADVEAVHVGDGIGRTVRAAAKTAGIPLRLERGAVIDTLVETGGAADVEAIVIGARGMPSDPRPLGGTALTIATSLLKPIAVVPPDARTGEPIRRVLVPLEGTVSSALAPRAIIEIARGTDVEVIALHVHDAASLPAFTDQPQHEQAAWVDEFLARYCPWGVGAVRLETRVGAAATVVPEAADECGCDLIALGWSQDLAAGRAPVVRAVLERARVPVLLVPVVSVAQADPALRVDTAELLD